MVRHPERSRFHQRAEGSRAEITEIKAAITYRDCLALIAPFAKG
jgi:hypothetical protein